MKKRPNFRRAQAGVSLVELGISIAIGAVMIGIGLWLVPPLMNSMQVADDVSDMSGIILSTQKFYFNRPSYAGLNQATVVGLGAVPAASVSAGVITNRWKGLVSIAPSAVGLLSPNDAVIYTSASIPSAVCPEMAQRMVRLSRVIQVGAPGSLSVVKADNGLLSPTLLAASCSVGSTVSMAFTFGK